MKITKYEHACVVLEEQGKKLVIDPGEFTNDFGPMEGIVAVVVTHKHGDHFNPEHLRAIVAANPEVAVYTTPEIASEWGDAHARPVHAYEDYTTGPFALRFFGEVHAEIHQSVPRPQNCGVLVNDLFYYPGDSFTPPDRDVHTLAVPASAPWLKIGEAMDFITAVQPKQCFPTHNALLSDKGTRINYHWLEEACKATQASFRPLAPGESLQLEWEDIKAYGKQLGKQIGYQSEEAVADEITEQRRKTRAWKPEDFKNPR